MLIDQFMLANPDFQAQFEQILDADHTDKDALIKRFGGVVVNVDPGTYRIERNPYKFSIIIHPEGERAASEELGDSSSKEVGRLLIDTRCIAMIDRELLDDVELLQKYQGLWFGGQDKACRDLLRDNGGAVRYSFSRNSDDLQVKLSEDRGVIGLWPDVIDVEAGVEE